MTKERKKEIFEFVSQYKEPRILIEMVNELRAEVFRLEEALENVANLCDDAVEGK